MDPIICFGAFFLGMGLGLVNQELCGAPQNRNTKKRRNRRQRAAELSQALQEESSFTTIHNELEGLSLIYEDDYSLLKPLDLSCSAEISIFLANHKIPEQIVCSLYLTVAYTPEYPKELPRIQLQKSVNISPMDLESIQTKVQELAKEKASLVAPFVYEISSLIVNSLQELSSMPQEETNETEIVSEIESTPDMWQQIRGELKNRVRPLKVNQVDDIKKIERQLSDDYDRQNPTFFDYSSYFGEHMKIGQGGWGSVYKALHKIDSCYYAIKKVKLAKKKPADVKAIIREVHLLSRLQHPNIVRYHNAWFEQKNGTSSSSESEEGFSSSEEEEEEGSEEWSEEDHYSEYERSHGQVEDFLWIDDEVDFQADYMFIQMEYCASDTLRSRLDEEPLSANEIWRTFKDILEGLNYIHARGMIHRDLKPANVFIGEDEEAKLGDFGLATTLEKRGEEQAVGTPMYCAPEQITSKKYDQSADMYSLGVIFFEMWRPFGSMMQRSKEITQLKEQRLLPEDFDATDDVKKLILMMTEPNSENRPSAKELLLSDYLPHSIDPQAFNNLLRVALNPDNLENNRLLTELFSKENPPAVEFTYNVSDALVQTRTAERHRSGNESSTRAMIVRKLRRIMKTVGFQEIESPLLYPFYDTKQGGHATCLMDKTGLIVQLPDNLTVPWARVVSRKKRGGVLKRFSINKVYSGEGGRQHPLERLEASIDTCFDKNEVAEKSAVLEAEILKISLSAVSSFTGDLRLDLNVNDSRVIEAILDYCKVPVDLRFTVLKEISRMERNKWDRKRLENIGINYSVCGKLEKYFKIRGSRSSVLETVKKGEMEIRKVLESILEQDLKALEKYCKQFHIENINFNFSLIPEKLITYSGLIFEICAVQSKTERFVLATGGRYDNLVDRYAVGNTSTGAVGARFMLETILGLCNKRENLKRLKGPDVLLTATTLFSHKQKLQILQEFWKHKISAVYNLGELRNEELLSACTSNRVRFAIALKHSETEAKVVDFSKGHGKDEWVPFDKLCEFIKTRKKDYRLRKYPLLYPQTGIPII